MWGRKISFWYSVSKSKKTRWIIGNNCFFYALVWICRNWKFSVLFFFYLEFSETAVSDPIDFFFVSLRNNRRSNFLLQCSGHQEPWWVWVWCAVEPFLAEKWSKLGNKKENPRKKHSFILHSTCNLPVASFLNSLVFSASINGACNALAFISFSQETD